MQMIHMPSNGLFSVTAQQTDEGSWTVMGEDDNGVRWIINDDFVLSYLVRGGTKLRSILHIHMWMGREHSTGCSLCTNKKNARCR